jgi:hypothetical protein
VASQQLTASELANQLLADALGENGDEWAMLNRYRMELIRNGNRGGLSPEESDELPQLQWNQRRLEPFLRAEEDCESYTVTE